MKTADDKNLTVFRNKMIMIYLSYSWILMLPNIIFLILSILINSPLPLMFSLIFFNLIAYINFKSRGMTNSVTFNENEIVFNKKGRIIIIDNSDYGITNVVSKGWWRGIYLEDKKNNKAVIWKHEFSSGSWNALFDNLKKNSKFKISDKDWTGLKYFNV